MNSNPMQFLAQMMQMGNNPQMIIQNVISQNPQLQNVFNQIHQNNVSTKDYVQQYARQNNIDLSPFIYLMSNFGIKL